MTVYKIFSVHNSQKRWEVEKKKRKVWFHVRNEGRGAYVDAWTVLRNNMYNL